MPKPKKADISQADWDEITGNPYLTPADKGLVTEYFTFKLLRDKALASLLTDGLLVKGYRDEIKTNPAYKVFRDASTMLLQLRGAMLATPASRMKSPDVAATNDDTDEIEID